MSQSVMAAVAPNQVAQLDELVQRIQQANAPAVNVTGVPANQASSTSSTNATHPPHVVTMSAPSASPNFAMTTSAAPTTSFAVTTPLLTAQQAPTTNLFRSLIDSIFKPAPADQTPEQHLLHSLQARVRQDFRNHDSRQGDELVLSTVKSRIDAATTVGELFSPQIIDEIAKLPPTYGDGPVARYADSIASGLSNKMTDKDDLRSQSGSSTNALNHLKSMASNPNETIASAAIRELVQLLNGDSGTGYATSKLLKPIEDQVRQHIAQTLSENPLKVLQSLVPERHFFLRQGIEAKTIGEIARMAVIHPSTSADALKFIEKTCHKFEKETCAQWREILTVLQHTLDNSKTQIAPENQIRLSDTFKALTEAQVASGKVQQPAPALAQQAPSSTPNQYLVTAA